LSHIVVATAGHIDHGKTALVRALTGHETDTLKEEVARKITIDLGFAFLSDNTTIIDVPGHEKFIKNMVTGVATVDFVLLVIAADDGIMPQTREHFDILKLLGLKHGMIVVSKADMVEEDWLELVVDEMENFVEGSFLENAPVCVVDSISGRGIESLRSELDSALADLPAAGSSGIFRLYVDRAFPVKGYGTVVTGTVLSGSIETGEEIEVLPGGQKSKVRTLQLHGSPVEKVSQGDRAAINIQGLNISEVSRGDCITMPGVMQPGYMLDVSLEILPTGRELKNRERVRVHIGTSELLARVVLIGQQVLNPGESCFAQLRLESKIATLVGDRFVVRRYSPQQTIGGGSVIDPNPKKHRTANREIVNNLEQIATPKLAEQIVGLLKNDNSHLWTTDDLQTKLGSQLEELKQPLEGLIKSDTLKEIKIGSRTILMTVSGFKNLCARLLNHLDAFHTKYPEQSGMKSAQLKSEVFPDNHPAANQAFFDKLLLELQEKEKIVRESDLVKCPGHKISLSPELISQMDQLYNLLKSEAFAAPKIQDISKKMGLSMNDLRRVLSFCRAEKRIVQVNTEIHIADVVFDSALKTIKQLAVDNNGEFTVSEAGAALDGASRRFTVPFLEYLDDQNITRRDGNHRHLTG
jgi:selenocysteine-specific elongation factor